MRHALLLIALLLVAFGSWACLVRTHRYHHRHPGPGGGCYTTCAQFAQRQICQRRCHIWRGPACIAYRQDCRHEQYCVRRVTQCR